jgi:hypothetical protein
VGPDSHKGIPSLEMSIVLIRFMGSDMGCHPPSPFPHGYLFKVQ